MTDMDARQRLLLERAEQLARVPTAPQDERPALEVTLFELGGECYGFESLFIREIVPLGHHTPLPCVPRFVAGIMNLRGQILSLLHLDCLLERAGESPAPRQQVIILADGQMEFGLLVEQITGIARIPLDEIQEDLATLGDRRRRYLRGLARNRRILLDAQRLLTDPDLRVDEEIN